MAHVTTKPTSETWWNRPCGGREVLALALPLVVSTVSWTLMNFIDRMFLMWYDTEAMAAAMPAAAISFTMICLAMGISAYVSTFVAQYHGAEQPHRIGVIVWQGVWIGVASIPCFLLLRASAPWLFAQVGHSAEVVRYETDYFRALTLGAGGVVISSALAGFFSGRGATVVVMVVSIASALLNIGLDYLWIFGRLGFSEGGIVGAGIATAVSEWIKVLVYLWLMYRSDRDGKFEVAVGRRLDVSLLKRLIWFGGPNGLQLFVEMGSFSAYLLLVGQLGDRELAATTLAFNVNSLAFVPMLGLGMAVSILVANQIGRNRADLAARATWTTLTIALVYTTIMGILYLAVPDSFLMLHRLGADHHEFLAVRDVTVVLLRFVAAYCLLDAVNIVFSCAIKGAGDTRFVLLTAIGLSPIPIVFGWSGIHLWNWGLTEFWLLVTCWISASGLIYGARFLQGKWRRRQVIEMT